ncbi:EamA family transporter RarD [Roseospirillum parvum]|uniref:Chloramphenicol-sensitive protein RarD n=1 Tax=Roseospirillum parvum TaxID=83401 RepID=A0A1G7UMA7_9PROT|nr:EamA family transporter RarD [Roseospirillum parvum]SDG48617.1 chloramphenicol-sensitive protein RarD [Roseospirillum parvum]
MSPPPGGEPIRPIGLLAAVAAYGIWGFSPLLFKLLASVPAPEILAHRVVWAVLLLALPIALTRGWHKVVAIARDRRLRWLFLGSTVAISINWLTFIWAVAHDAVVQTAMGYFIFPLVTVLLATLVLGEKLRRRQWLAIALVALGVGWMVAAVGAVPWIALILAVSFSTYGLLRKLAPVDPIVGLFVETALVAGPALVWLVWLAVNGQGAFLGGLGAGVDIGLPLAGLLTTALPLTLFAFAGQRMPLAVLGLMQYMNPTLQLLLATLAFGEPFTTNHGVAFGLVWCGLAVFVSGYARRRRKPALAGQESAEKAAH